MIYAVLLVLAVITMDALGNKNYTRARKLVLAIGIIAGIMFALSLLVLALPQGE